MTAPGRRQTLFVDRRKENPLFVEGSATPARAGVSPSKGEAFLFVFLREQRFALW